MGAEIEAHVWCDGPSDNSLCNNGDQNEYGTSITSVRAVLRQDEWAVRTRKGEKVDLCPICKELG